MTVNITHTASNCSYNRTMLELKWYLIASGRAESHTYNRTMLELKFGK